jgi:uncharacterized membrane protein
MADNPDERTDRGFDRTDRGFDRFVNFSDAVVAIAVSLLILPVVDAVNDALGPDTTAWDFVQDNGDRLFAFALSFVLIACFWLIHHRVFEAVRTYSSALMWWNIAWLATIVWLPLPTEILAVHSSDETFVRFLYTASVLLVSLTLAGLEITIDRDPDVRLDPAAPRPRWLSRLAVPITIAAALVIGTAIEAIGLWAMFLTALGGPLAARLDQPRRSARAG